MSSPARLPTGKANKRVHITDAGDKTVGKGGKGAAKNDAARTSGGPSKKGRKAASSDGDGESGADTDRVMQQDISGPDAVNLSRRELTDLALLPDSEDKAKVFVNGNALTRLKVSLILLSCNAVLVSVYGVCRASNGPLALACCSRRTTSLNPRCVLVLVSSYMRFIKSYVKQPSTGLSVVVAILGRTLLF